VVVAHNAGIDLDVLTRELPGWQPAVVVDTLKLARHRARGQASYRLGALVEAFDLGRDLPAGLRPQRSMGQIQFSPGADIDVVGNQIDERQQR
jgi:hypothetical protein